MAFTDVLKRPEEYGWTRMWWKCRRQMEMDSDYSDHGAGRLRSQWSWLLDKPQVDCVLEKSIANVVHASFLATQFNRPKFIHLVRNGYAVSEGIRRKAKPGKWNNEQFKERYPIGLCASQWVETLDAVAELAKDDVEVLEVRYEELTSDPDAVISEIFSFLELPALGEAVADRQWLVHGELGNVRNRNQESLERLSDDDICEIEKVGKDWLDRLGYREVARQSD